MAALALRGLRRAKQNMHFHPIFFPRFAIRLLYPLCGLNRAFATAVNVVHSVGFVRTFAKNQDAEV
jgi:hypothetical protein